MKFIKKIYNSFIFARCYDKGTAYYFSAKDFDGITAEPYTFKGNKVEAVNKITLLGNVSSETAEGKYEIVENADGSMEITFKFEEENNSFKNKTVTYKEGDGYIELGGVKYTKVEK
jgi:hypothetical protein